MSSAYGIGGLVSVPPGAVTGRGVPPASFQGKLGQQYFDTTTSPPTQYIYNGIDWAKGGDEPATTTTYGTVILTDDDTMADATDENVPTALAIKTYVDNTAISGAPVATETTAGIGELATDAEAVARTASTGVLALFLTPTNLTPVLSSPTPIGNTLPSSGTFTFVAASATGTGNTLTSDTASSFGVTGAGIDLTLSSASGSVPISAGEAVANAIGLQAAAGGVDIDGALLVSVTSSRNNAQAVLVEATAGGIDILASGASAGEDIDIVATGSSVNITSTENAADSIVISSSNGGIDITAASAAAGEDIDISAVGSSVNISSTENAALAITLNTNGGTSETIRIRNQQGTNAASVDVSSTAGGITVTGGLGTADAINIVASDAAGGIDVDAGTGGIIADTTGAISLDSAAASNFTVTGAFALDVGSTLGKVTLSSGQSAADSVVITSLIGGIDILAAGAAAGEDIDIIATGSSVNINSTENTADSIVISSTNGGIDIHALGAAAGEDIDIVATGSSVNINSTENVADSIVISSTNGGIDILASGAAAGEDIDIVATGSSVNISATENNAGAITIGTNGGTSEAITVTCAQGTSASSVALTSTSGGITLTGGLATADAINIVASNAAGGIDVDAGTAGVIVDTTGAISLDSAAASNFTVTGAFDLSLISSAGSVNITAGEDAADAIVLSAGAGGIDILATGAAAQDIDIVNTGGSVNITATENISSAVVITASGAAAGMTLSAGTTGITLSSGILNKITNVATAATPYAVLGTDSIINTNSTGGALEITLPAVPVLGRTIVVYDGAGQAAAGGNVTINGNGVNIAAAGTSAATKVLNTAYESYTLYYNGTIWMGQNIV